jgi:sterol desaturase/sphingolipid hydroxylase (fatty acid hydroxylase superfamily)
MKYGALLHHRVNPPKIQTKERAHEVEMVLFVTFWAVVTVGAVCVRVRALYIL